jgi:hypothetical protein
MNCKPGDLAIIVSASGEVAQHIGKIVRCISVIGEFKPREKFIHPRLKHLVYSVAGGVVWDIEESVGFASASDSCLRPIRDQPGEDEMTRIAGLPRETKQPELTT